MDKITEKLERLVAEIIRDDPDGILDAEVDEKKQRELNLFLDKTDT